MPSLAGPYSGYLAARHGGPIMGASTVRLDAMNEHFKIGDHVRWNSEAGHVSGHVIAVHTGDTPYKGHMRRCSADDPQYEIRSDTTDHIAMHKGRVLTRLDD